MRNDKFGPQYPLLSKMSTFLGGNHEEFFRQAIETFLSRHDPRYLLIQDAYGLAKKEFEGKMREGGERYFEHLRDVALIKLLWLRKKDPEHVAALLLHDLPEDIQGWTSERVGKRLKNKNVATYIDWMTKPDIKDFPSKEMRDHAYHLRLDFSPTEIKEDKLCDRLHNMITIDGCPAEKRVRKIRETEGWYLHTADKYGILYHELVEAIMWAKTLPN